jgi:hypothetical protein
MVAPKPTRGVAGMGAIRRYRRAAGEVTRPPQDARPRRSSEGRCVYQGGPEPAAALHFSTAWTDPGVCIGRAGRVELHALPAGRATGIARRHRRQTHGAGSPQPATDAEVLHQQGLPAGDPKEAKRTSTNREESYGHNPPGEGAAGARPERRRKGPPSETTAARIRGSARDAAGPKPGTRGRARGRSSLRRAAEEAVAAGAAGEPVAPGPPESRSRPRPRRGRAASAWCRPRLSGPSPFQGAKRQMTGRRD